MACVIRVCFGIVGSMELGFCSTKEFGFQIETIEFAVALRRFPTRKSFTFATEADKRPIRVLFFGSSIVLVELEQYCLPSWSSWSDRALHYAAEVQSQDQHFLLCFLPKKLVCRRPCVPVLFEFEIRE